MQTLEFIVLPQTWLEFFKNSLTSQAFLRPRANKSIRLYLCPSCSCVLNPHHFGRVFNYLSRMSVGLLLFNKTEIGMGVLILYVFYLQPLNRSGWGCRWPVLCLPQSSPLSTNNRNSTVSLDTVTSSLFRLSTHCCLFDEVTCCR